MGLLRRPRRLYRRAMLVATVAAIAQEMGKPEAERTWTGTVLGFVPYDFRPPTWDRIREAYWNPDDPRILTPKPLGAGWVVNLYRGQEVLQGTVSSLAGRREVRAIAPIRRLQRSKRAAG